MIKKQRLLQRICNFENCININFHGITHSFIIQIFSSLLLRKMTYSSELMSHVFRVATFNVVIYWHYMTKKFQSFSFDLFYSVNYRQSLWTFWYFQESRKKKEEWWSVLTIWFISDYLFKIIFKIYAEIFNCIFV